MVAEVALGVVVMVVVREVMVMVAVVVVGMVCRHGTHCLSPCHATHSTCPHMRQCMWHFQVGMRGYPGSCWCMSCHPQ